MSTAQFSVAFFLQAAVILIVARAVGGIAERWLGQPRVVGEMIAGILLGPSLLGSIAPAWQAALFPAETKPILYVLSQLGVGLYMFIVGLGFRRDEFRALGASAVAVSLSGMAVPFVAALLLAPWLMGFDGTFADGVDRFEATLFLGAAIAITAFPMLARIIHERGLSGTPLGTLCLSAGAIDDAGAWVLIAVVLASMGGSHSAAALAIGGGIGFAITMIWIAPRLLARLSAQVDANGDVTQPGLAMALILFLCSAWAMDAAGIHAVFGGFLLGTAMPRGAFADGLRAKLEPVTLVFLLPFFFTYLGLATDLQLLAGGGLVLVALVVIAVSILAKGAACYAAARLTGQPHPVAMGIGGLMNARGLMELIVINIGLSRGVIEPPIFAILVLMAIITTLMATPLFRMVQGRISAGQLNQNKSSVP